MTILENAGATFTDIIGSLCSPEGNLLTPTDAQQSKIEADIASYDLLGRGFIAASGTCLAGSYITWGIPYLGPLLGTVLAIIGVVFGVIGHDALRCSSNLEPFTSKATRQAAARTLLNTEDCESDANKKFVKLLYDKATQNTLIARSLFKFCIAAKLV